MTTTRAIARNTRGLMLLLVELDRVQTGNVRTPDSGHAFIEQTIFPTLARTEQLVAKGGS
jgi:hypothetical protein